MKATTLLAISLAAAALYVGFGVKGWLGRLVQHQQSPDHRIAAEVYSHSPVLLPFARRYLVRLPSKSDLNGHDVFESHRAFQKVTVRWRDGQHLEVDCKTCNDEALLSEQVDDVQVVLVRR